MIRSMLSKLSTGSGIAITRPDGRGAFSAQITRAIFFWNFVGLAILLVGVLLLSETRAGLIQAQVRNLRTQGELIANVLVESGTIAEAPAQGLNEPAVRMVLRRLLPPVVEGANANPGQRIRVFAPDGAVVADTDLLYTQTEESPLAPIGGSEDISKSIVDATRTVEKLRITPWRATISREQEQARALLGDVSFGQRLNERGDRVVAVTLPIRMVRAVHGVITLESADVERILVAERIAMIPFFVGATVVTILSSLLLTVLIAQPLRRLSEAADRVRQTGARRLDLPSIARRKDEIGALSASLSAMTDALFERIEANQRFAADVSHEIKNPLASIRSAVDTAVAVKEPERQRQLLAIIAQDVLRLDRLITDISRASRIEAETARTGLVPVDVGQLLSDIAEAYRPAPGESPHCTVRFDGAAGASAIVMGQEGPLGQVFRNLIDNARSFSPPGGVVRLQVSVRREREGAVVRATVEDDGPGIPAENLETIFQRFYTERPKGAAFGANSGLGLSIARQIVTALKGRIHAENISGTGGARLIVELPLAGLQRT